MARERSERRQVAAELGIRQPLLYIFEYIETFYNRTRRHSSLAYRSPINFESNLNK